MPKLIEQHSRLSMLVILIIETMVHIFYGYSASGNVILLLLMLLVDVIRYVFILIAAYFLVRWFHQHQFRMVVVLPLVFMIGLTFIPKAHFETLGALLSMYQSGPGNVLAEVDALANKHEALTCIGYPQQRFPCDNALSPDQIPSAIRNVHIGNVLVMDDYVLLEKFGLQGNFRGFLIFSPGSDIWKNEDAVKLQKDCSVCWRIRVIKRLYWYQASPSEKPIFLSPLN